MSAVIAAGLAVFLAYPVEGRDDPKYRVVGRPVAARTPIPMIEARRRFGLPQGGQVLLVFVGSQGAGFLLGLKTNRPAKDVQRELLERDILAGTSADPSVLRLLPPFILDESHVRLLQAALKQVG